jgi:hypothetical protein
MAKRVYAVKEIRKLMGRTADASAPTAMGGTAPLGTKAHALSGPEHTEQLPTTRLSTMETDPTLVFAPDGTGGVEFRAGAPATADYLVGTAQADLSAEIVVGTTPGGELGGTWASPTVDGTHSGSAHSAYVPVSTMTTLDDIIVGGASGAPARLGKGTDGQVLTVDPTTHHLLWATPAAGSSPLTTKGDIHGFSTVDVRVPIGTDAYVLTADSAQTLGLKWAASASGFADPTTTKGDLIVHGSTTDRLPVGSNTQVLTADSTQTLGVKWAAGGGGGFTVEEVDGTPTDSAVTKLVLPNGTLAIVAHVATYTPAGGAAGALVLLEQHTASSSATLDFTTAITSTYDEYRIEMIGIVPATNGAVLSLRCSTDGGSTYDTSAIYDYAEIHTAWGSTLTSIGASSQTSIPIFSDGAGSALLNTATPALVGSMNLFQPGSTTNYRYFITNGNGIYTNGGRYAFTHNAVYRSTTAVNAFRFSMSSGNIASGTIRVYGLAK